MIKQTGYPNLAPKILTSNEYFWNETVHLIFLVPY